MPLRPEAPGLRLMEETPRKGQALPRTPSTGGPPIMATGPGRRSEGWAPALGSGEPGGAGPPALPLLTPRGPAAPAALPGSSSSEHRLWAPDACSPERRSGLSPLAHRPLHELGSPSPLYAAEHVKSLLCAGGRAGAGGRQTARCRLGESLNSPAPPPKENGAVVPLGPCEECAG